MRISDKNTTNKIYKIFQYETTDNAKLTTIW